MTLPAQNKATEPCPDCFNPDMATRDYCLHCQYPRFILNPAIEPRGIGCTRCINFSYERLGNEFCGKCRSAWPEFMAPAKSDGEHWYISVGA